MSMVYFVPGEVVELKQEIMFRPQMIVKEIKKSRMKDEKTNKPQLMGVLCFWFTNKGEYQEQIFNTKDLVHSK